MESISKDSPLVSVIIPVYNASRYIETTLESVLRQSYGTAEIIVVDDGSTDNSREILRLYADSGKIKYILQENKGQSAARNRGLAEASGKYISFFDSDDLMLPDRISEQVKFLETHPDCGACYSDIWHFFDKDEKKVLAILNDNKIVRRNLFLHKKYDYPSGDIFKNLLKESFINPNTLLTRKEVLDKYGAFNDANRRSDEWYLYLNLASHGIRFCYLPKVLVFYRIHAKSLSDQPQYLKETAEMNLKMLPQYLDKSDLSEQEKENILNSWKFRLFLGFLLLKDKPAAVRVFRETDSGKRFLVFAVVLALPAIILAALVHLMRKIRFQRTFEKI